MNRPAQTLPARPRQPLRRLLGVHRGSMCLIALGLLLPILVVLEPPQPMRSLAAASVLMVLPGLALAQLLGLRDLVLSVVVTVASSLALTVLTSTGLLYAGVYSWQLCLVLVGLITAGVAGTTVARGPR